MLLFWKMINTFAFLLLPLAHVAGEESAALRGSGESPPLQVLVFDAGSSGTRIHVFNVIMESNVLVPRIDLSVKDRQNKKVKPGLSSYAENNDFAGAEQSIVKLMEFASELVPPERRASTPVLLKATAGLRSVKPASKADAILERVRETLMKSGYLFKPEWAAIIKGKEEAGLAWVAANYLQGNLKSVPDGKSSLGVIEMGGGSTQVTFEVGSGDASRIVESDTFTFTNLAGAAFHLYAHSYLGYGMDHAEAKFRTQATEAEDPCYQAGYVRQSSDDATKFVTGTGNAEKCQEHIRKSLLASSESTAPGMYSGELPIRGRFAATENFFYVRSDLKLPLDGSMDAMKEAAKIACEAPLNPSGELEAAMRDGTADASKFKSCFGLAYQAALLDSLRAGASSPVQVEVARTINGGDIDWALGAALMHFIDSGMWKTSGPETTTDITGFVMVVLVLGLAAGAARFFAKKQVAAVASAVRAATLGRSGWIEVATKNQASK